MFSRGTREREETGKRERRMGKRGSVKRNRERRDRKLRGGREGEERHKEKGGRKREDTNTKIPTGGGDRNGDCKDIKKLTIYCHPYTHR